MTDIKLQDLEEEPLGHQDTSTSPNMSGSTVPTPCSAASNKAIPTPSPSSAHSILHAPPPTSRRPPRKSTLTQQQKNQKRQRATQDQLATLEMEFNRNPTPDGHVRTKIADEINMTERSVQIWFQNRRAKIKMMAKKSLESGDDLDSIPESMRQYLAMQAMDGKGLGSAYFARGLAPYGHGHGSMFYGGDHAGQGKVLIHHIQCRSLSIGKWIRVGQSSMDLVIFYSPDKCTMTYYINNDQAGYKIEYPFAYIKHIFLDNNETDQNKAGGGLVIELNHPPNFYIDSSPTTNGFQQCGDFTEDHQATSCLVHHLGGNPKVLSGQLVKLMSLDVFIHRHHPPPTMPYDPLHGIAPLSAPVSPVGRPSSQPNCVQPHPSSVFPPEQWATGLGVHHTIPGPGHKRQRSQSVPMAVDFSMLQTPMPSFFIQQPGETQPQPPHAPDFYSTPPQPNVTTTGPVGPNLRIDTQAGFGLDMRQHPMSAVTAPSDYSSPAFFSAQAHESTPLPTSSYNTPYSGSFLSPMANPATLGVPPPASPSPYPPSATPGHADPAIVDQSPPISLMSGRGALVDIYPPHESSAISDDGTSLNDMYSKHTLSLPMQTHSPSFINPNHTELDLNSMVHFESVDPASLSPESVHHQSQ